MKWITRERPKIDRIACPWLIKRFIDQEAEIVYVPPSEVKKRAKELEAIPFDIPNVEHTHYDDKCTFDYFLKKYRLEDPSLLKIAEIVRAADTDRHDLSPQSSGLWALTAGLAYNIKDDQELLQQGMVIYDALYSWAKHLQGVKHTQNPSEALLHDLYQKFLRHKPKSNPIWVKELKELIQDQVDTEFAMNLEGMASMLGVHPAYLSREFSKYFDDLSFGEYIRKLRIEKAIGLMKNKEYSLSEIAYLTGFSDQSHFTRVFKQQMGVQPSVFRRKQNQK